MKQEHTPGGIEERVLATIESGRVHMRPRAFFTLKLIAIAAVGALVLLLSIALVNFMLFSIRISGHDMLLGFGPRGFWAFFLHFPWPLLMFDIAAIALLSHLFRQFRFGYRTPVVYVLLGLAFASAAAGLLLDRGTPFNDTLYKQAGENRLPSPLGGFYASMRHEWSERDGLCRCTVVAMSGDTLIVADTRNASSTYTILLPPNSAFATTSGLLVGDTVMVAGDVDENGVIHAFGLRFARPGSDGPYPREQLMIQKRIQW